MVTLIQSLLFHLSIVSLVGNFQRDESFFACPSFFYIRVGFFGSGVNSSGRHSWQRSRHCAATFLDDCGAMTPGPWRFLGFSRTGFTLHHRGRMQVHVLNCHPINSPGFRGNTLPLLLNQLFALSLRHTRYVISTVKHIDKVTLNQQWFFGKFRTYLKIIS